MTTARRRWLSRWLRSFCATLPLALAAGCGPSGPVQVEAHPASYHAWARAHRARVDTGDGSWEAYVRGSFEAMPLERIHMRRWLVDTDHVLTFERGGRATRSERTEFVPEPGETVHEAAITAGTFAELCWLVESLDLPSESTRWSYQVGLHTPRIEVGWVTREGSSVVLASLNLAAPPDFELLLAAIELAGLRIVEWVQIEPPSERSPEQREDDPRFDERR